MDPTQQTEREFLHSLVNPLAIASGLLELSLDQPQSLTPAQLEIRKTQLEKAFRAVERAISLVKERQKLARGE